MKYKHQSLFDELKLKGCPPKNLNEIETTAFRWSHSPINDKLNFLPNVLYDRARGRQTRLLEKSDYCPRCNLSFYTESECALTELNDLRKALEQKHKDLIFYTHVATGKINKKDGVATEIKDKHFMFYEYEGCDFVKTFSILEDE